jgi:GNAT superfamily N-acetyltransferase
MSTHDEHRSSHIRIRLYVESDREFLLRLTLRLAIGLASWRDPQKMYAAARRWIEEDIAGMGERSTVLVAEDAHGAWLGFVTMGEQMHFTGEAQAYVGELLVAAEAEGRGVGRALMTAAEEWARAHGYGFVALDTGAAKGGARAFYGRLGYREESVKLVKTL